MALVLMLANRMPLREEFDEVRLASRAGLSLTSKYDLDDTIRQIERSLRRHGLPMVAKVSPPTDAADQTATHVLVLGDEGGQTPVVQSGQDQALELPWKLLVSRLRDGRTVVLFNDPSTVPVPEGVSLETLQKVRALPRLLRTVLT
jgi:uncharacterized protein (DUF302 family)